MKAAVSLTSHIFSLNGDTAKSDYLDSLFKVEHFPVDLVADHPCVHFWIHHFNG